MDYSLIAKWKYILTQEHSFNFLDISCTFLCANSCQSDTEFSTSLPYFDVSTSSSTFPKLMQHPSLCVLVVLERQIMGIPETPWAFIQYYLVNRGNNLSVPLGFVRNSTEILLLEFLPPVYRSSQNASVLTLCRSNLNPYCMGRKAAFFSVGI
jgi:hypothetical protein